MFGLVQMLGSLMTRVAAVMATMFFYIDPLSTLCRGKFLGHLGVHPLHLIRQQ
jgi:hypothetical protein